MGDERRRQCNSRDMKILHGEFAGPLPTILRHEAVGEVVEVGPRVHTYKPGDLVVRPRIGALPDLGLSASFGSFTEFGIVTDVWAMAKDRGARRPWHNQTRADSDWEAIALDQTITLKETLSFLRNFGVKQGHSLLIFGTGPVGVSFSCWARDLGCDPVIVVGRGDAACVRAREFGRATHTINASEERVSDAVRRISGGVTHAIEEIDDKEVLHDCLDALADGG